MHLNTKVIVFDLDDTLYPEITYVYSGFNAVSNYLSGKYDIPIEDSFLFMKKFLHKHGRGKVFDALLNEYSLANTTRIKHCLTVYRKHLPNIALYDDAIRCLNRFKLFPIYIVTDGNKMVQNNKVNALLLQEKIKKIFITHRYGIEHSKPSPYCFEKICSIENVLPNEVVYIGDNPQKDFVGIKPLGFQTIRILRGSYAHITPAPQNDADYSIRSLDELQYE